MLAAALEALEEILDVGCAPGMLTQQQLEAAFAQFRTTLEESTKRRAERQGRHATEDFDADEAEALQVAPSAVHELACILQVRDR